MFSGMSTGTTAGERLGILGCPMEAFKGNGQIKISGPLLIALHPDTHGDRYDASLEREIRREKIFIGQLAIASVEQWSIT